MATTQTDDGVNLANQAQGDGPLNLLFMHGWAGSGAFFAETIAQLDLTGLRAITYDMRGHGASDKPASGYTLDHFAQDAFTVADTVGAAEIVPIGYSMSGKFAQYLAVLEPDRIRGQILVTTLPASEVPFPAEMHQAWVDLAGNREALNEFWEVCRTSSTVGTEGRR